MSICNGIYEIPYIENEYHNAYSDITLICKIHGSFITKLAYVSRNIVACPKCSKIDTGIKIRNVASQSGICDYERYHSQLPITDGATEGPNGELQVRCKLCQTTFTPTRYQVYNHIYAINKIAQGECNLYCSDKCKSECTVYNVKPNKIIIQNNEYEARVRKARNCQKESKYVLRQIQLSLYGYHFCDKCGVEVENNQLHHTIEVAKDPDGAITPAGHMLVCERCHKELHYGPNYNSRSYEL